MKWECVGVKEHIDKIESFLSTSNRKDKNLVAYKALKGLDKTITSLMDDEDNDIKSLFTYRRRVRLLLRGITN